MKIAELKLINEDKQAACYVGDYVKVGDYIYFKGTKWIVLSLRQECQNS